MLASLNKVAQKTKPDRSSAVMTRRAFHSTLVAAAVSSKGVSAPVSTDIAPALQSLLLDWCDGLLQLQIDARSNPAASCMMTASANPFTTR